MGLVPYADCPTSEQLLTLVMRVPFTPTWAIRGMEQPANFAMPSPDGAHMAVLTDDLNVTLLHADRG